ncbi:MAG: hypothetical protein EOO40_00200 [Deltaproteobacteria bacterium]|nr:MAG: hypothetical protein EOO40_00200 [Deltaproteobacteria bacterium]
MWLFDCPIELLECDETVDVIRQGLGTPSDVTYVDGLPTAPHKPLRISVQATLQPMGGRDFKLLGEGFRISESLSMWQPHQFNNTDVIRVDDGDIILYGQKGYQVQSAKDWGSFTQAALTRIDLGPYADLIAATEDVPDIYTPTYLAQDPIQVGAIPLGDQMANFLYDAYGLPPDNLGNPGDLYLDLDTYICYGPKTIEGWPATGKSLAGPPGKDGKDGKDGVRGNYIFRGDGPPSAQVLAKAIPGDLYIDRTVSQMYPLEDSITGDIPFNNDD